jgi:hypothetical protein
MKKLIFLAVLAATITFPVSLALGVEFAPIGSESISMGGAGVASAKGSYAPYYNPALLAEYKNNVEIGFAAGASVRDVDLAKQLDELSDFNIETSFENIDQDPVKYVNDINSFINVLYSIPTENGLQVMPGINLGCQIKQFGIGMYTVSDATASAVVDPTHNQIIVKTDVPGGTVYTKYDPADPLNPQPSNLNDYNAYSIQYALDNGLTYLDLTGLAYVEIPVSGGYQFDTKIGKIDVGGSIKVMPGYTLDKDIKIDTSSGDVSTDLRKDTKSSVSWGIDLGLLYKPPKLDNLSIGFVGKNLNTPQFKTASYDHLKVKPMARMGVAYGFLNDMLSVAIDADLTKNETYIPDYYSQYIGGGLNFQPISWFSIRAGLMQNIQESKEGLVITGGLGIGPKLFQLDLSAFGSTKKASYNGNSIPEYVKVQLGISSKW